MASNFLFIIDEIESKHYEFNKLVTNFWLIREFLLRGIDVKVATKNMLYIKDAKAFCQAQKSYLCKEKGIALEKDYDSFIVSDFDAVFFRPDPPVDVDYINACSVFDYADFSKTKFFNNPLSVRNFNEKLSVNLFPDFAPENIVTTDKEQILDFVAKYNKVIIKPLNRCYGSGVFILKKEDKNVNSIIDTITEKGKTLAMVQKYLEPKDGGDKRVLIIGDKVLDECLIKIPAQGDFKSRQYNKEDFKKGVLTPQEREMAQVIAKRLSKMGLPLVGLDVIDGKIIEINITSPCYFIKEISELFEIDFQEKVMTEIFSIMNC